MRRFCRYLAVAALLWVGFSIGQAAEEKVIRLRNETIATAANGSPQLQIQDLGRPLSGLYLIQFTNSVQIGWQQELLAHNVELLRYVPDDAFIVRFNNVRAADLRQLSYIQWIGPYKPEHKIYSRIPRNEATVHVRVLLAPDVAGPDWFVARRLFQSIDHQSTSRFGAILQGWVTQANLSAMTTSEDFLWIEPAAHPKMSDEISSKIVGGDDGDIGTRTYTQQLGFTGKGVAVAVADSGIDVGTPVGLHPDIAGRVDAFMFYGALTDASDEHGHGTHVSGIIAGNAATGETDDDGYLYGLGVAPEVHLIAQRIFDGDGNFEAPPSNAVLTRDAVRTGAVIGSNSWGDDVQGRYDLNASEFDALVRDADPESPGDQPYILEFSAGNAGPGSQTIDSPAVGKNVIASGAAESDRLDFFIYADGPDTMADFSSRGPTEDGRIKPDVVAPGTWISSLQSGAASDDNAWAGIDNYYQYEGGTSQSGPHVSGAAAVFVQYYRQTHTNATPSPAMVKAALINSARDMDDSLGDTGPTPNMDEGWGEVDLTGIIGTIRKLDFLDQTVLLTNSQVYERQILVASSGQSLKITMTYTDVPGFPGALPALVNDLDLEVIGPDGAVYRGNQFDSGEAIPNAPGKDNVNNVEGVHLAVPTPGLYTVRVIGRKIVSDSRRETAQIDQDFALVCSGDLAIPGYGFIFLDKGAYKSGDIAQIKLIDFDLGTALTVTVTAGSSSETNAESIVLSRLTSGVFTGAVQIVSGTAVHDGRVQVKEQDTITLTYQDQSPIGARIATAVADFTPPVISKVMATNYFGQEVIIWTTDEPATSQVFFGTNASLGKTVNGVGLTTDHSVTLTNLVPQKTYYFTVGSTDEAGNSSITNNAGQPFTFTTQAVPPVLLVNNYVYNADLDDTSPIPVTSYTDPLDAIGVHYEIWDVPTLGSPKAADLAPFEVVIWRINDSVYTDTSITAAEQTAITNYLSGGGAFFMASMEILSRAGITWFATNVFHVAKFNEDVEVEGVNGVNQDLITSGMSISLDYSAYPYIDVLDLGPDFSDTIVATTNATTIFNDQDSGVGAAVRYPQTGSDAPGRVVFMSFPFDSVPMTGSGPNNRPTLLKNILEFLDPGLNGNGTITFDRSSYTIPSLLTVEVADSDLAGIGHTNITIRSSTSTNGINVVVTETPKPGLFRGSVILVSSLLGTGLSELVVKAGDDVSGIYYDASANNTLQAHALVDVVPPVISGVQADPEYAEATISWTTSEPSDSLVQFGESSFLGRTAYDPTMTTDHEITVVGLVSDETYDYQITSRDVAGNTAIDDNKGKLYTFTTLKPIIPYWFDNLENSGTNWTVLNGDGSEVGWTLGMPNNGWETQAHSGTNAWGSNLGGDAIDAVQTFLVSPTFLLTGGNTATLRFWQSYNFPVLDEDIYEIASLQISTNNGDGWTELAEYTDSQNWDLEEIDLTPYIGQIVRFGWDYELFSFDTESRPGWLLDDISVEVTNVTKGTISVSNNLAQGTFTLSGPTEYSGGGWLTTLTNMVTGTYVITFNPVAYYKTPAAQTNLLTTTTAINFTGRYTFDDVNTNGIPDGWELAYFGSVSNQRTSKTDTDKDGVSDYAEFVAGTNPTNAQSFPTLHLGPTAVAGALKMDWPSLPNHAYQVESSADFRNWLPLFDWSRASGTNMNYQMVTNAQRSFFRLKIAP